MPWLGASGVSGSLASPPDTNSSYSLIGIVIDGVNNGGMIPAYGVDTKIHETGIKFPVVVRTGRGSQGYPKIRLGDFTASGQLQGLFQAGVYPMPSNAASARGTLTLGFHATGGTNTLANYIDAFSVSVMFNDLSFHMDAKNQNNWHVEAGWTANGAPSWKWNGTQVPVVVPANNTQETYTGLSKVYDPRGLATSAKQRIDVETIVDTDTAEIQQMTTLIAAAVSPINEGTASSSFNILQISTVNLVERNSNGAIFELDWQLTNTAQKTLHPMESSFRSAESPFRDAISVFFNDTTGTMTLANIANNQWAIQQGQPFAYGLTVKHGPNPYQKIVIADYINPGIQVIGSTYGAGRMIPARYNASNGHYEVYLPIVRNIDGVRKQCRVSDTLQIVAPRRRFMVIRALTGNTVPDTYPFVINGVTLPPIGTVNGANFLGNGTSGGLAAGTVLFDGSDYFTNLALSANGNWPFLMRYMFTQDSVGMFNYLGVRNADFVTSASVVAGWNNVTVFSGTDVPIAIEVPATGNFTAFTA